MSLSWLRQWAKAKFHAAGRTLPGAARPRGALPCVERLEDRQLLSFSIGIGARPDLTGSYPGGGFRNLTIAAFGGSDQTGRPDNNPQDYTAYIAWGDRANAVVPGEA